MKVENWEPKGFEVQKTSIWSFRERGNWATHDSKYRGNWSPFIPRNVILRYSKQGDLVLDQFAGGGTTLVEAILLNRNAVGIDVNEKALARCKEKCDFQKKPMGNVTIRKGDARSLDFISDGSIDLICTHPPYADIVHYSNDIQDDLSLHSVTSFLYEMRKVANECYRVLKKGKYCAVLMGDIRRFGNIYPLGFEVMNLFLHSGFQIKEIVIKEQHNCKGTTDLLIDNKRRSYLLLVHEYLLVFRKVPKGQNAAFEPLIDDFIPSHTNLSPT